MGNFIFSKVFSSAIIGLEAQFIEIETEVSYGLNHFTIVGLPDKAVEESKERVGAAIKSSGFQSPYSQPFRTLISLAPADVKKEGSLYDLPIALGFLIATKQIRFNPTNKIIVGELGLNGNLRPIKGVLSIVLTMKENGLEEIILPKINAPEAFLIKGIKVKGVETLREAIECLESGKEMPFPEKSKIANRKIDESVDLGWIKGQEYGKRALKIAAAGGHNILMEGPPGAGKTLLAKAIPSILPLLSFEESVEVTKIYSLAGFLEKEAPFVVLRPFRNPHHTASEAALIGGGNPLRFGEITLAHRGVLFLDEFPEFHRDVLESLRQPLEDGKITVLRAKHRLTLPAKFILVAATNPCPCGYYRNPDRKCTCQSSQIAKYKRKLSGPLMDRIDLFINIPALKYEKLVTEDRKESGEIRENVEKAREIQKQRFKNAGILVNSEMPAPQIKKYCQIESSGQEILRGCVDSGKLSARGYHRVLKVARTIADLDNATDISHHHLTEALSYRERHEL